MLKKRILTAAILIPCVLLLIFYANSQIFTLITGLFFLLASWEWTRLSGFKTRWGRLSGLLAIPTFLVLLLIGLQKIGVTQLYETEHLRKVVIYSVLVFWCLASIAVASYPRSAALFHSKGFNLLIGTFVLVPAWATLVALQIIQPSWLLYPLLLVWVADTGAYFMGKRFGRHPLAPALSPGKTWEGVVGAFLGSLFVMIPGYFLLLNRSQPLASWILLNVITVLFSIVGDLFESLFKREQNLKDSGSLLPGHGGILDRIDSLTAALPIFAIGLMFF